MTEKPWDYGTWRCEACGQKMPGERGEPPLDHVHSCEGATGQSLVFEEDTDDGDQSDDAENETCELCGDDAPFLHSITSEPGLPSKMQSRLSICSGCHDALEPVEGDECAWCGGSNASTVTVVGAVEVPYTLGRLCRDCLDGVNA